MGIMEKKMETALMSYIGFRVEGLPRPSNVVPFWVWYGFNRKENGNYCSILGLYWGYMKTLQCSSFLGLVWFWG